MAGHDLSMEPTMKPDLDELRMRIAKAIFFDQHSIMHDHDENWRTANQVIWLSAADAAMRAADLRSKDRRLDAARRHIGLLVAARTGIERIAAGKAARAFLADKENDDV